MAITPTSLVSAAEMTAQSANSTIVSTVWEGNVAHDGVLTQRWEDWRVTAEERLIPEVATLGAAGDVITSLSPGYYTFAMPTRPIQETLTLEHLERAVKAPIHVWETLDPEELVEKIRAEVLRVSYSEVLTTGTSISATSHVRRDTSPGMFEIGLAPHMVVNGNT